MRFWDASALVPLLVDEPKTRFALEHYRSDPEIVAWWATPVECVSAIGRLERGGKLELPAATESLARLNELMQAWHEVLPSERIRETAWRLLRVHDLRSADALQLSAALYACDNRPGVLEFVCLDARLAAAAWREGFALVEG